MGADKDEIVAFIATHAGLSKKQAKRAYEAMFDVAENAPGALASVLRAGRMVRVRHFGIFAPLDLVGKSKEVHFRSGKGLGECLNATLEPDAPPDLPQVS